MKQLIDCHAPSLGFTLFLLAQMFCLSASAQMPRLQFQHVSVEQGLSHPSIHEICEDSSGFMWFGAFSGLNRFDGREIKSIDWPSIHALCTAENGDVWSGAAAGVTGLSRLSFAGDTIFRYPLASFGAGVRAIVNDRDSSLWVGTDIGLFHLYPRTGECNRMGSEALADSGVNSIADDRHGNLWLVTRGKIVRFEKATEHGFFVCSRPGNWHSATSVAPDGSIWVAGGIDGRLLRIDPKSMRIDSIFDGGPRVPTTSLTIDASGIVYVGTQGEGLMIYDPAAKSWVTYRHRANDPFSIADDYINTVVLDEHGDVWAGTKTGVSWTSRCRKQFFRISIVADNKDATYPEEVRDVVEDDDGDLWLGTWGGGLWKWDRKRSTITAIKTESPDIYSLALVHHDELWIGMRGRVGLRTLKITDTTSRPTQPALLRSKVAGNITAMFEEGDTTMWFGCNRSRLYRHNLRSGQTVLYRYETPEELFPGRVAFQGDDCPRMIYRDRRGTLWIATCWGILKLDERAGQFQRYLHTAPRSFQENTWCVYEDRKGSFWVGTDLGFELFDRAQGEFHPIIRTSHRLAGQTVVGILEDQAGVLWLQTDGELLRYNHTTGEMKHYGPSDGFPITTLGSFFTLGNRARCITHTGEFVFGIRGGIVLFRPEEMRENPNKPAVAITGVELLGQPMPRGISPLRAFTLPKQPLRLSADQNALEFTFAGLEYTAPSQNKYAVWLEPEDRNWLNIGTDHSVRFANLSPGSYRLRVKAANNDDVWSAHEASYRFEILPPWWMTWWFRALMGLIVISVIVLVMQLRLGRAVEEERLRTNIARDLHDDLSATLSSITFYSEAVRQSNGDQLQHYIGQISEGAREAKEKISDIIWSVDPHHDDSVDFLARCERFASDLLESKGILHEVKIDKTFVSPMSHDVRQNLWLIFKEIIVNLARHSCASHAIVAITRAKNSLVMTISDNGKGFDAATLYGGNGLNNIRKRAESIGASIALDTTPGGGTRWRIEVSL